MDAFARALLIADQVLAEGKLEAFRRARYASFDTGPGKDFAAGKLGLADLCSLATTLGEPPLKSGRQEMLENILFNALR
jgi:xylose isomerase